MTPTLTKAEIQAELDAGRSFGCIAYLFGCLPAQLSGWLDGTLSDPPQCQNAVTLEDIRNNCEITPPEE